MQLLKWRSLMMQSRGKIYILFNIYMIHLYIKYLSNDIFHFYNHYIQVKKLRPYRV